MPVILAMGSWGQKFSSPEQGLDQAKLHDKDH